MASKGRIENLKPFPPGVSGNPSGRPKKKPITDRYEAVLEQQLPDDLRRKLSLPKGSTYGDALALRQVQSAISGKNDAAKEIADRVEGKAPVALHVSGPGGKAIRSIVTDKSYESVPEEKLDTLIELGERILKRQAETDGRPPEQP